MTVDFRGLGRQTVETLKGLLSMHRNSIACGGESQGWREGGGGEIGGMIPTVGKRTVRFSPVILFKIAYDSPEDLFC